MRNSDEMQSSATPSTASGDELPMPGDPTIDRPVKRQNKRPSGLSVTIANASVSVPVSGLTPSFNGVCLQPFATDGSEESEHEFTFVPKRRRSMRTNLVIDVKPKTLSSGTFNDLSNRQLLRTYIRDKDKRLVAGEVKVFQGLDKKLIGTNLLKGFEKADKPKQRKLKVPKFSIKWFLDYLHRNQDLLTHQPNFICAVSTLRLLICACYEQDEVREWEIYAKKLDGIWYLSEGWLDYDGGVEYDVQYAARMFEILSTEAESVKQAAKLAQSFLRHEKAYQVWLAQLGEHRLLYSGDVDCVDKSGCAVELKAMTRSRWASKLRRSWAQVHLMGSKKVVVGYVERSRSAYTLTGTEEFDAASLKPNASATWQTEICNACLDKILHSLKCDSYFQDEATTYTLKLDREERKITAKRSTIDLPLYENFQTNE